MTDKVWTNSNKRPVDHPRRHQGFFATNRYAFPNPWIKRSFTRSLTTGRWYDGLLLRRPCKYVQPGQEACTAGPRRGETSNNREQDVPTFLTISQCNGSDVFGSDICTCRPYRKFILYISRDRNTLCISGKKQQVRRLPPIMPG